tara:strand:- start:1782 stop:2597 length:816 start_codon:yes stop_codon:yes gene_type:complete
MHKAQLAYIAGFVDGDGCIHLSKKRYDSKLQVSVTDFEPVQFMAKHFNKKIHIRSGRNSPFNVKPQYWTVCSGFDLLPHLKSLLPFLVEKRNNAFSILKQYNAYEDFPYLQHTREEFFAWLAGFSEAEGHFSNRKRKTSKPKRTTLSGKRIYDYTETFYQLVNTNESLINYVLCKLRDYGITGKMKYNTLKSSSRMCPVTKKIITRKPIHRIFLGGGDALFLYKEIYPFMKIKRKKDKIIESIKLSKERKYKHKRLNEALKHYGDDKKNDE